MSGRHASGAPVDLDVEPAEAPLLRVVAGDPTPEELAAVTALFAAVEAGRAASAPVTAVRPTGSAWTRSARAPRPTVVAGEGRWRGFSG